VAAAATLLFGAAGCGGDKSEAAAKPETVAQPAGGLTVKDPWVKAADKGMTAAFGTLVNSGTTDVTVVSAASAVSPMELHEMAMQDGAMVMRPVKAGEELTFTLTFADGRTSEFRAVAKPFTGAGESYAPSMAPR
jgi:periplasmic copper chaperone A